MKIRKLETVAEYYTENDETFLNNAEIEDDQELEFIPDEYDKEDGKTATMLAAKYMLNNSGCLEASCSSFGMNIWYSSGEDDMHTGDYHETSWHIVEATEEEQKELYELIKGK